MSSVVNLRPNFDLNDVSSLTLDLANPKPKEVAALVEMFDEAIGANPDLGPLPVSTGWNEITPTIAVDLLKRNRPGANRKIDPPTVFYYANQMARGEWKATGQPILLDVNSKLQDAQHRLYGVLISGATIKSFVVVDIDPIPNLFAYIDNARPRTAATALQTAGFNGVAAVIYKVVRIGEEVRHGVYNHSGGIERLQRLSPADVLGLMDKYPNAQKAARSAASDWDEAVTFVSKRKDVIAYFGMRIIDLHDEAVADDFFEAITDTSDRAPDDPISAFRKEIEKDARAEKPMKKHHVLAALIKTFNAWRSGQPLGRRWMLQVNEDFPVIDDTPSQSEAAE